LLEIARLLRLSKSSARRKLRAAGVPEFRFPSGPGMNTTLRFAAQDLEEFLQVAKRFVHPGKRRRRLGSKS